MEFAVRPVYKSSALKKGIPQRYAVCFRYNETDRWMRVLGTKESYGSREEADKILRCCEGEGAS